LLPVQRTAEELERWKQTAIMLARRYVGRLETIQQHPEFSVTQVVAGVAQEGKITGACGYCEHYDWCGSGQAEWLFEARYSKKVWDPQQRDVVEAGDE
jgi:hypothetical protein